MMRILNRKAHQAKAITLTPRGLFVRNRFIRELCRTLCTAEHQSFMRCARQHARFT